MPELVVPGWYHAPRGEYGEEAQGGLGSGGALEAWCMVPARVVPGWGHAPQGAFGEEAQDLLGREGALEIWNIELTQCVLSGCPVYPGKCEELE